MNAGSRLPVAAFTSMTAAPGHETAYDDLAVAQHLGMLTTGQWAALLLHSPHGWVVTISGRRWLDTHQAHGLAERHIRQVGHVVTCPAWCTEDHPRVQVAASEVQHTAYEAFGGWGYAGVIALTEPGQPPRAPILIADVDHMTDHTPDGLREAGAALITAADVYEHITG